MIYETISILLKEEDQILDVREVIASFKSSNPNAKIGKLKFGEISDKILISFKIEKDRIDSIVKLFIKSRIRVLSTSDTIRKAVTATSAKQVAVLARQDEGWQGLKKKKPKMSIHELENYAEEGNYEEILKVAGDLINYGDELVETAKKVMSDSVTIAIDLAVEDGKEDKSKAGKSISKLMNIASNKKLKAFHKIDLMKKAGLSAVDICTLYRDLADELIRIGNNNDVHNIVNISAAVQFAYLVFEEEEDYAKEIESAVKVMNIKWLMIAYDVAQFAFSPQDKEVFEKLIKLIEERRKAD